MATEAELLEQLAELRENYNDARELGDDEEAKALRADIEAEMDAAAAKLLDVHGVALSRGSNGATVDFVYTIDWPGMAARFVCLVEERKYSVLREAPVAVVSLVGFGDQRETVTEPRRLQRHHATVAQMQPGKPLFAVHPKTRRFEAAVVERITLRGLVGVIFKNSDGTVDASATRAEVHPWETYVSEAPPPRSLRKKAEEMTAEEKEEAAKEEARRKRERIEEKREAVKERVVSQAESWQSLMKQVSRPQPTAAAAAATSGSASKLGASKALGGRGKPIRKER